MSPTSCPSLHEARGLLEERRVYSKGVGGSCSMHNPWPVGPHPRGVRWDHACWAGAVESEDASRGGAAGSSSAPNWAASRRGGCRTAAPSTIGR